MAPPFELTEVWFARYFRFWLRDNKERLPLLYRIGDQVLERCVLIAVAEDQMLGKRLVLIALARCEAREGFTLVLRFGYAFEDIVVRYRGVMVKR